MRLWAILARALKDWERYIAHIGDPKSVTKIRARIENLEKTAVANTLKSYRYQSERNSFQDSPSFNEESNEKKYTHLYVIMTVMFVTPAEALKSEFIMASESSFNLPHDLALSPDGRYLYAADNGKEPILP